MTNKVYEKKTSDENRLFVLRSIIINFVNFQFIFCFKCNSLNNQNNQLVGALSVEWNIWFLSIYLWIFLRTFTIFSIFPIKGCRLFFRLLFLYCGIHSRINLSNTVFLSSLRKHMFNWGHLGYHPLFLWLESNRTKRRRMFLVWIWAL